MRCHVLLATKIRGRQHLLLDPSQPPRCQRLSSDRHTAPVSRHHQGSPSIPLSGPIESISFGVMGGRQPDSRGVIEYPVLRINNINPIELSPSTRSWGTGILQLFPPIWKLPGSRSCQCHSSGCSNSWCLSPIESRHKSNAIRGVQQSIPR